MIWFDKLLTKSRAFALTTGKQITQFFTALENVLIAVRDFISDVYLDIWPASTRQLDEWDAQFGLPPDTGLTDEERRTRLDAAWKRTGGQSPRYLQDTMQAAGFPVYIHEWWEPGTNPPVARDPNDYIRSQLIPPQCFEPLAQCGEPSAQCTGPGFEPGVFAYIVEAGEPLAEAGEPTAEAGDFDPANAGEGYLLVNKLFGTSFVDPVSFGDLDAEFGEPGAEFGVTGGVQYQRVVYTIPPDPDTWPYFLYWGGEVFGTPAFIPGARRDEFENLLLQICPAQQWLALLIEYFNPEPPTEPSMPVVFTASAPILYDQLTWQRLPDLADPPATATRGAAFSPDGAIMAIGYFFGVGVNLYQTSNWEKLPDLVGFQGTAGYCDFNPSGTLLALASYNLAFSVYETGTWNRLPDPAVIPAAITLGLDFNHDGSVLAVAAADSTLVYLYDTTTWNIVTTLTGMTSGLCRAVKFSNDGAFLAVGIQATNNQLRIFRTSDWVQVQQVSIYFDALIEALAWSPDDTRLAVGVDGSLNSLRIFNTSTWDTPVQVPIDAGVYGLEYNNDGSILGVATTFPTLYYPDTDTLEELETGPDTSFKVAFCPVIINT